MDELMDALNAATNVRSIQFSKETQHWEVNYKGFVPPDFVTTEDLIDFLEKA